MHSLSDPADMTPSERMAELAAVLAVGSVRMEAMLPAIRTVARHVERDRRIVEMKLEGLPQMEIAAALGVTPPAVSQRLRALRMRWEMQAVAC